MPERLIHVYKERCTRFKYDSVIGNMTGAMFFSKTDMEEAYQQLELSKNCRCLANFRTEKGIMRLKRLCYGINNSFQIF